MAPQQPHDAKMQPLHHAMRPQRLDHVVRTAWLESATSREERTQHNLIRPHKQYQQRLHIHLSSAATSAVFLSLRLERPTSTQSESSGTESADSLKASRIMRFARLRSTAS
jgi:hypothetical protein